MASQQSLNQPAEVVTEPVRSRDRECAHSPIRVMIMCADRNGVDRLSHKGDLYTGEKVATRVNTRGLLPVMPVNASLISLSLNISF